MTSESDNKAMVIDNGSGMCKAGFSGEAQPRTVFPEVIGKPKYEGVVPSMVAKDLYFGEEALEKRGVLKLSYPIESGIVKDWDMMQQLWYHTIYHQLRVEPSEYGAILTEAPLNPKINREKMAQIFFETFKVPKFYVAIQAVLSLYAAGRTTGMVLDSGDGVSHTVPVFEGYSIPHAIMKILLAGRDLTHYMTRLLTERGWNFVGSSEQEIVREVKEKLCMVVPNFEEALALSAHNTQYDKPYTLPDGQVLTIGSERFRCPELLFKPSLEGRDHAGIHTLTFDSVEKCDMDVRRELFGNIILSGGSTMFPGLPERLESELRSLVPQAVNVAITAMPERKYSVWIGGSVISSLSTFESMWVTKKDYEEIGAQAVTRKCFQVR